MTESRQRLPLFILAGSDEHRANMPRAMRGGDMLEGYKGAIRLPNGLPLVAEVVRRFRDTDRFQDPVLIGPARIYRALELDCEVIDSEGDLSRTLARTIAAIHERVGVQHPVAITTCDILPSAVELTQLLDHHYEPSHECVFWGQLARAKPPSMGASSWKHGYRITHDGEASDRLYPGHLTIVRPDALRVDLTIRLLHLAYRHRNMPLLRRAVMMSLRGLGMLLWQDLRNLPLLQLPILTVTIPYVCWSAYMAYRNGHLSVTEFESAVMRLFVRRSHRHRNAGHPVVFAVTDILSLAKDLDTKEELLEAMQELRRDEQP